MIFNPNIFLGEQTSGLTDGAPVVVDVNGQIASGLTSGEANSVSSVTAGTTGDVLMTGMTFTTVAGASYLVWFSCDINSATAGSATSISFYVGGTQKADSLRKVQPFDGGTLSTAAARCGVAINGLITTATSVAIEVRWSASNGTNTVAARTLNWLRIS